MGLILQKVKFKHLSSSETHVQDLFQYGMFNRFHVNQISGRGRNNTTAAQEEKGGGSG